MAKTYALLPVRRVRLIGFCSSVILLVCLLSLETVDGKPFEEIFPTYGHRDIQTAISTLKTLDNQYNKFSRPRFGKRMSDYTSKRSQYSVANPVDNGLISDDWILLNRALPLSKFSESYLRQFLAQNDRLKVEQQQLREHQASQPQQQQQLDLQTMEN